MDKQKLEAELKRIEQALQQQEGLRGTLDDDLLAATLTQLHHKRQALLAQLQGDGAVAQGEASTALGKQAIQVGGNVGRDVVSGHKQEIVVVAESGAHVYLTGEAPVVLDAVTRQSALGRYLAHVIAHNRYLRLQGIRSGGRLVNIELAHIYITLRATSQQTIDDENRWLHHEMGLAPGEGRRQGEERLSREATTVTVNEALAHHARLVVLGDPGSGKTTLLRFLALIYARALAEGRQLVSEELGLAEEGKLPILLPLRQIGAFLRQQPVDGTEGHGLLLRFLYQSLQNERVALPADFFDSYLQQGQAVVLLDGLDEVADPDLRRRVARLVEAFTRAYSNCRFVVTSRVVGYEGAARLGEAYGISKVRDFRLADVEQFLSYWHRLVKVGEMGPGESAATAAKIQTETLMAVIRTKPQIRDLAINPLLLTVIALVHRDRVKLPDRRAELYEEAVNVLLGKWDEARGVVETPVLDELPFDTIDKRLMLQAVALEMHNEKKKEIEAAVLRRLLFPLFRERTADNRAAERAVSRFLQVIEARTGLLVARAAGVYAFSHLTFQEYLAAQAIVARDDYIAYTLQRAGEPWWREVVLLTAGCLSLSSKERMERLIGELAEAEAGMDPYRPLVLAVECARDVGEGRVPGELLTRVRQKLRAALSLSARSDWLGRVQMRLLQGTTVEEMARRRVAAATALAQIETAHYWSGAYGEPEWVEIPAGPFLLGSNDGRTNEQPQHELMLERFEIARVPITNTQYQLFVEATGHRVPHGWEDGRFPKGEETHPVVGVAWYDALAYCRWLGEMTGKAVTLPSEAEWEKAARGTDGRTYPWGNDFDRLRCNGKALGLGQTTPVGIFQEGASPYGVLDMSGNVWEWTRSIYGEWDSGKREFTNYYRYPYIVRDMREDLEKGDEGVRIVRGGSFYDEQAALRCAYRLGPYPYVRDVNLGFRIVVSPFARPTSGL